METRAAPSSVQVELRRLEGSRIESGEDTSAVKFNVDVKMQEQGRTRELLVIEFTLLISTKPSMVKFEASGVARVSGGQDVFKAFLEVDPETNVPRVLHNIYQNAFTAIFVLSTLIGSPYPPPDLLHSTLKTESMKQENSEGAERIDQAVEIQAAQGPQSQPPQEKAAS